MIYVLHAVRLETYRNMIFGTFLVNAKKNEKSFGRLQGSAL
jgi:hypothetical protein